MTARRSKAKRAAPQRIIEAAIFEGAIGPVTAKELIAMSSSEWGMLRDRITDFRHGRKTGLACRCMMCGDPVFIRARKKNGVPLPLFSHFQGGGLSCPWHSGTNTHPEHIRASQYDGQQESHAHRLLCETIDALARLDERYIRSDINAYRPPTENEHGRYPDVAVIWRDFPECIFEVQLSSTFQTEISGRCTHYEREGAALLWIMFGFDPLVNIAQSFIDVIRRHRGNAFVIDSESVAASHAQQTLILKCYMQNENGGFDLPRLVRLDALVFPKDGLPYCEDRISKALLARNEAIRRPCFDFLTPITGISDGVERDSPERTTLVAHLRSITPVLSHWETRGRDEENAILRLIACLFSMVAEANGKPRIYGNGNQNIRGMLNGWLHTRDDIKRYALIFERALERTPLAHLKNGTVGEHVARAKADMAGNLCLEQEPEWELVRALLPEIFNPVVRDELLYLSALPRWAMPA